MNIFNLFRKKPEPHIRFMSYIGNFAIASPVVEARRFIPEWVKKQVGASGSAEKRVSHCPGMMDYMQAGFIIRAHVDIHIKANSQGMVVKLGTMPALDPMLLSMLNPQRFDFDLVKGMIKLGDKAASQAHKIPLPWAIYTKPGWSAQVLPALMHAEFLDKLWVYPGIVDYDRFHTVNLVVTPLKDFELIIHAGDPLLQVIPFKREDIHAECGKATEYDQERQLFGFLSRRKGNYRRLFHSKKTTKLVMTTPSPAGAVNNDGFTDLQTALAVENEKASKCPFHHKGN